MGLDGPRATVEPATATRFTTSARSEPFWSNLFGAIIATGLAAVCFVGPLVWHVKSVPGVLACGAFFAAGAGVLWREQWRRR